MDKYDWVRLNHIQLGRYAEYFVKMEFTLYGFDVYTSEVDDRGIDFVIRKGDTQYFDVQVKSIGNLSYIFFPKDKFQPRVNLLAAAVIFTNGKQPSLYLIPSTTWLQPNSLFVNRDYEGLKRKPKWGLNNIEAALVRGARCAAGFARRTDREMGRPAEALHSPPRGEYSMGWWVGKPPPRREGRSGLESPAHHEATSASRGQATYAAEPRR